MALPKAATLPSAIASAIGFICDDIFSELKLIEMEYKLYKIYDPDVNNIVVGIRLADCMNLCNTGELEKDIEENVTKKIQDLTISNVLSCSFCNVSFNDALEQRSHFKLDWHRYNLKRALCDKSPVTEDVFDGLADDVSSISGSESDISDKEDSDSGSNDLKEKKGAEIANDSKYTRGRHSKVFFQNSENKIFSVYKCLLHSKKETVSNASLISSLISILDDPKKWLIVMLGGGHFAAAIFDNDKVAEHKTFHCYTVRAKQGGSQSSRDNKGGGHPKSAGASLRRYNEQALIQHVQEIMSAWSESLKQCQLIFFRATGRYNRGVIFGGKNPPLDKNDPRLRNIPFPTRRATFKEVKRVHDILCTLEVYGCADEFKDKYPRSPDKRLLPRRSEDNNVDDGQPFTDNVEDNTKKKKKKTYRKIDRSKARSSPEREIPGEVINEICKSESYDDDEEDKVIFISDYIGVSQNELKEYDDTLAEDMQESTDSDLGKTKTPRKRKRRTKTAFDRQFESIQRKLLDSCERGDLDLLIETLSIYDSLPETIDHENRPAKGNLLTKKDFIKCLNTSLFNKNGDTVLHLSASHSLPEFTTLLLEAGADPTIKNKFNSTPYTLSGNKETKNSFKQFVAKYPDKVNCKKAEIPAPVSEEMRLQSDEKRKEKNKIRRQRGKIKRKEMKEKREEEEEKQRFLALSDREKRALAADRRILAAATANVSNAKPPVLARCFLCGVDITGKVPFEYRMNRFCSIPCVKAHRSKNQSYSLNV